MTKTELVAAVAESVGVSKAVASRCVDALFAEISGSLKKGREVVLPGFGKFRVTERAERTGRNPATGETITIPASKHPAFKPSTKLKESVNN